MILKVIQKFAKRVWISISLLQTIDVLLFLNITFVSFAVKNMFFEFLYCSKRKDIKKYYFFMWAVLLWLKEQNAWNSSPDCSENPGMWRERSERWMRNCNGKRDWFLEEVMVVLLLIKKAALLQERLLLLFCDYPTISASSILWSGLFCVTSQAMNFSASFTNNGIAKVSNAKSSKTPIAGIQSGIKSIGETK